MTRKAPSVMCRYPWRAGGCSGAATHRLLFPDGERGVKRCKPCAERLQRLHHDTRVVLA